MYCAWGFRNFPRADFEIAPIVLPFVLPPFPAFFERSESSIQTHTKPTHTLLDLKQLTAKRPNTQTAIAHLCRLWVIREKIIDMTRMGSDIQRLFLWLIWPVNQVLYVVSHQRKKTTYTSTMKNYYLLIFLLEHKLNKEIFLPTLIGCTRAPFRIGWLILSLGK